jgi:hypothetical protein
MRWTQKECYEYQRLQSRIWLQVLEKLRAQAFWKRPGGEGCEKGKIMICKRCGKDCLDESITGMCDGCQRSEYIDRERGEAFAGCLIMCIIMACAMAWSVVQFIAFVKYIFS